MNTAHPLRSQQRYQLVTGLQIILYPQQVKVVNGTSEITLPSRVLPLLAQFNMPTTLAAALETTSGDNIEPNEWLHLSAALAELVRIGALVTPQGLSDNSAPMPSRKMLELHTLLLDDIYRTEQYFAALRQVVKPGDVVLDIGTGSGVLSIGAAQAGARHVYAVEGSVIARTAREIFTLNGLSERVTVIEDWSTQIALPERADVLVSEIIGSGVFGQNLIESTADALERLLKPGARLIPNRVRMYASPVQLDETFIAGWQLIPSQVARWQEHYHADFAPLYNLRSLLPSTAMATSPQEIEAVTFLGDPVLLVDLDLTSVRVQPIHVTKTLRAARAGVLHGALIHLETDLAPGITLTTHPHSSQRPKCWGNPIWFCEPADVSASSALTLTLRHPAPTQVTYEVAISPQRETPEL